MISTSIIGVTRVVLHQANDQMNSTPFATIVVPTFNQAAYLGEALESLIRQTDQDWEAIVVNDGSTDGTREVAESYASKDPRIRCIHQQNGGVAAALNTGLRHARGEWIHWLSSDDLFEPHKLALNRKWIERYPETSFFFSYFTLLRQESGIRERRDLWGPLPDQNHQIITLFYRNYVSGITICARRTAWEKVGYFDTSLRYAQDYDQWLRLLQQYQGRFIPDWMVVSRNHSEQGSETFPDACYYDTAKAAIRFINRHDFSGLTPFLDKSSASETESVILQALQVACDRTSFLYSLGIHPGFILRILEWTFSDQCPNPSLKALVKNRVLEMAEPDSDDDWVWMWKRLALAVRAGVTRFEYAPVDTTALALKEWRTCQISGDLKEKPLAEYLQRFEGVDAEAALPEAADRSRIAFLCRGSGEAAERQVTAAQQLARRGLRPVVIVEDNALTSSRYSQAGDVPILHVNTADANLLPWLGTVEILASTDRQKEIWVNAISQLHINAEATPAVIEREVLDFVNRPHGAPRPVVFLERVLWGGGAERVVYDLACNLDRRKYKPIIFTMFDEHTASPPWPADIMHVHIRKREEPPAFPMENMVAPATRHAVRPFRSAYQALFPLYLREKLQVGRILRGVYRRAHRLLSLWQPPATFLRNAKVERETAAIVEQRVECAIGPDIDEFDFIGAMAHHNPAAVALSKNLKEIGSDAVVLSVMEEAAVTAWLAQAARPFPYIATLHTLESTCLRDIFPDPRRHKAEKRLLTLSCNDVQTVTLPSDGCCEDLITNFAVDRQNVIKVSNPIDCARIRRLSGRTLTGVENWKKHKKAFRLISVGRLDPQKNHDLLLQACAELRRRGRDFSLTIVGDGWYRSAIEKTTADLGLGHHVTLAGAQENPFPWIAAADAMVLTSRFEAFALVLAEAMACGTPVVSVNCPTGPAEVLDGGRFGMLVEENVSALADGLELMMSDPALRQKFKHLGFARAEMFDIKNVMPKWEHLMAKTLPFDSTQR